MGRRELYRPIRTPLSHTSHPVDVVGGIMSIYPFATLYIADLDAIEGTENNRASIVHLKEAFPQVRFWVDSGIADAESAAKWLALGLDLFLVAKHKLMLRPFLIFPVTPALCCRSIFVKARFRVHRHS